jgi:hypothetical protein
MIYYFLIISLIQYIKSQQCPISISDCPTVTCTDTTISCENYNTILEIPKFIDIQKDNKWTTLTIRNTNINKIYTSSFQMFINVSLIVKLDLSNNKIDYIEKNSFLPFSNTIKYLILTNNKLISFQLDATTTRLNQLFLDNNFIKDFHVSNTELPVLTNLYLSYNNLSILPIDIKLLTLLNHLDLSFNPLVNLPRYSFSTLISLTTLNLNGLEDLKCFNDETFIGLKNLVSLFLTAPLKIGLKPDICWFSYLIALKEFQYNTTFLLAKQNINLQAYDYCSDQLNQCWLYILTVLKKITVKNPLLNETVCIVDENLVDKDNCVKETCSASTCDSGSYEILINNINKTTTTTSTANKNISSTSNLAVILGSILGVVFFLLFLVFIMILYFLRKKKYCFKKKDSEKSDVKNGTLFFGEDNNGFSVSNNDDDDDYLNNVGTIVNIVELSDNSVSSYDEDDEDDINMNKNVRFSSNVIVVNNDESISNESDMIETIYEDEENSANKTFVMIEVVDDKVNDTNTSDTMNSSSNTKL